MAQVPYEFLVRWDHQTGVLKGAHCKIYDTVTGKEGDAQVVSVAGAQGFPLSEILTAIELGSLLALNEEQVAHNATKVELATANDPVV